MNPVPKDASAQKESDGPAPGAKRKPTQADLLVELALAQGAELFLDPDKVPYLTVDINGHYETWPVKSSGCRMWLRSLFYEEYKKVPSAPAIQDALGVLEGKAVFDGLECPVWM